MAYKSRYLTAFALAGLVGLSAPACAAQVYGQTYPRGDVYGCVRDFDRRAYDNGYREGLDEGRNDARHNRNFSYDRHSEYRDADDGYHRRDGERFDPVRAMKRYYRDDSGYDSRYGSRDDYKRDYGAAFEQGYREGYGRR